MNQPKELEWNRLFAYDLPVRAITKKPHECCAACREAREVKCVCACGGKNHMSALKQDMKRLDEFEDDAEDDETGAYIA